jgi:hypothetical protein
VRRGVVSDIFKWELTEQLIWSFFVPARGMSLCGLCLCFRYGLHSFLLQIATKKPKKYSSTHNIAPLQHHHIIALLIKNSLFRLRDNSAQRCAALPPSFHLLQIPKNP